MVLDAHAQAEGEDMIRPAVLVLPALLLAACMCANPDARPVATSQHKATPVYAKITTVSDSLTNSSPTNWVALVGKELGAKTQPEAHGGWSTSSYFRERLQHEAWANLPTDADLCIILIGSNDLFEDGGGSEKSIEAAVAGVQKLAAYVETKSPGVRFMLAAPPIVCLKNVKVENPLPQRRIDQHTPAVLAQLSQAYRELAAQKGWLFVDLQPVLNENDFVDAAHPNDEGNQKIASAVVRAIRQSQ